MKLPKHCLVCLTLYDGVECNSQRNAVGQIISQLPSRPDGSKDANSYLTSIRFPGNLRGKELTVLARDISFLKEVPAGHLTPDDLYEAILLLDAHAKALANQVVALETQTKEFS